MDSEVSNKAITVLGAPLAALSVVGGYAPKPSSACASKKPAHSCCAREPFQLEMAGHSQDFCTSTVAVSQQLRDPDHRSQRNPLPGSHSVPRSALGPHEACSARI